MEELNTKTPEKISAQECVKFAEEIKNNIVETFPFESDEERKNFEEKIDSILNDTELLSNPNLFLKELRIALASLNNTHTLLKENGEKRLVLKNPIYYQAGKFWTETDNGVSEVFSIDGISIQDLINEKMEEVGGGTNDWKIRTILGQSINTSDTAKSITIETTDGLVRTDFGESSSFRRQKIIEGKSIDDNIGYLKVTSWSNKEIIDSKSIAEVVEEELQKIKGSQNLIIDVRLNSGGDSNLARKLAEHFIDKPVKFVDCFKKIPGKSKLEEMEFFVRPNGDFIDAKLVILTGPRCLSSNELFILMLKDTERAITLGQTTGGGSGCPKPFYLKLGNRDFTLNVSTWRLKRNNGQMLENQGIEPNIIVEIKPEDVINKKDTELEKAIEYLRNN